MNKGNILLIHGTWCNGGNWASLQANLSVEATKSMLLQTATMVNLKILISGGALRKFRKLGCLTMFLIWLS